VTSASPPAGPAAQPADPTGRRRHDDVLRPALDRGGNDLIATHFGISLNGVTWFLRFAVFLGPVLAFWVARRIAIASQRADRDGSCTVWRPA
jgi:hypothetical protein